MEGCEVARTSVKQALIKGNEQIEHTVKDRTVQVFSSFEKVDR
jgi:hypothetical protein